MSQRSATHSLSRLGRSAVVLASLVAGSASAQNPYTDQTLAIPRFIDISDEVGLTARFTGSPVSRCLFADLNNDGLVDIVSNRQRVLLNTMNPQSVDPIERLFVEVQNTGLPIPEKNDCLVFADLDNDGTLDAIITRYLDINNADWNDHGFRTSWHKGRGDGTFAAAEPVGGATTATTACMAVGDMNRDGHLDLFLGNWYQHYGKNYDGFVNDLLLQNPPEFATDRVWFERHRWYEDGRPFDEIFDGGGRPTYGVMIAELFGQRTFPQLLELNYGRRWNRLRKRISREEYLALSDIANTSSEQLNSPPGEVDYVRTAENVVTRFWIDLDLNSSLSGDHIRHGRHPEWLKERAKTDARFDREDERPFRANGNTFDVAIGDIDNDGDFDLFLTEITHGWAGESADRSRFLLNRFADRGETIFDYDSRLSVDRIPANQHNWNQGDLFCVLEDMNHDGRLDLLLSSGDYPDNQRLRLFLQNRDGRFVDVTAEAGLDHDGSQQISVGDINQDGALDILVGQTFFRYTAEMKEGRKPRLRLFINQPPPDNHRLVLYLEGDTKAGTNRDALGAIVKARVAGKTMQRQLIGIGGHAGKQMEFLIHFGLGRAATVDELTIIWPNAERTTQTFLNVGSGRYRLHQGSELVALQSEAP